MIEHKDNLTERERKGLYEQITCIYDLLNGRSEVEIVIRLKSVPLSRFRIGLKNNRYILNVKIDPFEYHYENELSAAVRDFLMMIKHYYIPIMFAILVLIVLCYIGYTTEDIILLFNIVDSNNSSR